MNYDTMKDDINVIPRRPAPSEPPPMGSFQQLRSEGLRLLQSLCGYQWTDYNIHDPGVTMLEAQCYALTDIVYRADMPVADHLSGDDGHIDFAGLSLHPPEDIYACRPTSTDDIRRALLDAVPAAEDIVVTVVNAEDGTPTGRYHIDTQPASFVNRGDNTVHRAANHEECLRAVADAYRNIRNVGEDLQCVEAIDEVPCHLHADVEIATGYDPVDMLAAIYDRCYRYIATPDHHEDTERDIREGDAPPRLDEILDGPKLNELHAAHTSEADVPQRDGWERVRLFVGDLGAEIAAIPGVTHVTSLWLVLADGTPQTGSVDWRWRSIAGTRASQAALANRKDASFARLQTLTLAIPVTDDQQGVKLIRRGETIAVSADDVRAKFVDLQIVSRAHRPQSSIAYADFPRPQGRHVSAAPFVSSQLHLPAIYGLNRYGVPASASPAEHAIMRQTKAYLALCDQVMANAATQLQHVRTLYSADWGGSHSYWWRMLDEEELPGVRDLYDGDADLIVKDVYSPFERFYDRKNRILDYLLALYGETYTQGSLHKFSSYLDDHELQHWLLKNKTAFVQHVMPMGRDRAGGFDYGAPSWERPDKCAGLQARVSLLLGFDEVHSRSLTRVVTERRLDIDTRPRLSHADQIAHDQYVERIPYEWAVPDNTSTTIEFIVKAILRRVGLGTLLHTGVQRSRYRLLQVSGSAACVLLLECDDKGLVSGRNPTYSSLAQCASRDEAIKVAARLRDVLLGFNRKCEGLHLVEHCLLRPQQTFAGYQPQAADDDFFNLCVSFVFPAWTARTRSTDFRCFAEETIALNCPAHVRPQCLWLNFKAMCDFENDYRLWLDKKAAWCRIGGENDAAQAELNRLAAAVVGHLGQHTGGADGAGAAKVLSRGNT